MYINCEFLLFLPCYLRQTFFMHKWVGRNINIINGIIIITKNFIFWFYVTQEMVKAILIRQKEFYSIKFFSLCCTIKIYLHKSQTAHCRSSASQLNTYLLMIQPPLHIRAIPPKFNFHPKSLAASLINIKPWA